MKRIVNDKRSDGGLVSDLQSGSATRVEVRLFGVGGGLFCYRCEEGSA